MRERFKIEISIQELEDFNLKYFGGAYLSLDKLVENYTQSYRRDKDNNLILLTDVSYNLYDLFGNGIKKNSEIYGEYVVIIEGNIRIIE